MWKLPRSERLRGKATNLKSNPEQSRRRTDWKTHRAVLQDPLPRTKRLPTVWYLHRTNKGINGIEETASPEVDPHLNWPRD